MLDALFAKPRAVLFTLALLLTVGFQSYVTIPKESSPEVAIPILYVTTVLSGISPEDGLTQIAQPLLDELDGIEGLDSIETVARQGNVALTLSFTPSFDAQQALDDVRRAVDRAGSSLPQDAEDPVVVELNTALFPIASLVVAGDVPERTLAQAARALRDAIEGLPGVLEVDITGLRDETLDILIDPEVLELYDLQLGDVLTLISRNNQLITAGRAQNAQGDIVLSLPGLIDDLDTLIGMPIKVTPERVLRVGDIATVRPTFQDRNSDSALNGTRALTLDIKKKSGANTIETVEGVNQILEAAQDQLPTGISTQLILDESKTIKDLLGTLEANVLASVLLVMGVILWGMGLRNALLVGLGVPGAFLVGVLLLSMMGYTMNIVVLFALILVVGLLVDGTIVTVEYADTLRRAGMPGRQAFRESAKRMSTPIIAATATTIAVFFPLLFWDQVVGDFMKYLPITVILTLCASLLMALIFVPIAGAAFFADKNRPEVDASAYGEDLTPTKNLYTKSLTMMLGKPLLVITLALVLLVGGINSFRLSGNGVVFFPEVEPDAIQIAVESPDRLSFEERLAQMYALDTRIADVDGIAWRSLRVAPPGSEGSVGSIRLTLQDWWTRSPADDIINTLRPLLDDIPGATATLTVQQGGPGASKPFSITLAYEDGNGLAAVRDVRAAMQAVGGFADVEDNTPKPGLEWRIDVDRSLAAELGADIGLVGQSTRLYTDGVVVSSYRPENSDESIDIRVRMHPDARTYDGLMTARIPTPAGYVPLTALADITLEPSTGFIRNEDGQRVHTITANLAPGVQLGPQVDALEQWLQETPPTDATWSFGGDAEEQADASAFLTNAFLIALGLMFLILLVQFNRVWQALLVLSAIIFSVGGVFFALAITGKPFIIVMGGIGIIALAGIVINTNILLIDTWNLLRSKGLSRKDAAYTAAAARFRPVMLTTLTTILGLLPMSLGLSLDILGGHWELGAPATQWWTELALTISGGLVAGTLITLYLTPVLLGHTWPWQRNTR